jgi:ATP-dependent RNA helicase DeaD
VASKLVQKWYKVEWLHGDISQNLRERTLARFKNQVIRILVATDVAARGIDVNNLTHVINYTLPENPETYTHRIWRTGRAWNKWEAISLVGRKETRSLFWIEKTIKTKIQKAELPDVKDLIKAKKERLILKTKELLEKQNKPKYLDLADDLLKLWEANIVLSAILEEAFWNEYLETHYKKITTNHVNNSNQVRLFIAKWKLDNIKNPWQLIKFVEEQANHKLWDVGRIDIKDKFSFMNVLEDDAYILIKHFKKLNSRRPLITQAKERR